MLYVINDCYINNFFFIYSKRSRYLLKLNNDHILCKHLIKKFTGNYRLIVNDCNIIIICIGYERNSQVGKRAFHTQLKLTLSVAKSVF